MASGSAGMSGRLPLSANSQADSTTKAGLANSEGWNECPPIDSQRRAPLISGPMKCTAIMPSEGDGEQPSAKPPHARAARTATRASMISTPTARKEQVPLDEVVASASPS